MTFISFVVACLVLLLVPISVMAQNGEASSDAQSGLFGLIIAVASTVLIAFGIGGSSVRRALRKIHTDNVDFDKVDGIVETMLGKIGLPPLFADIIGDVVAWLAVKGPSLLGRDWMSIVKEMIIDEVSRRSAKEVSEISQGTVPPELVANRTSRFRFAETLVKKPIVQKAIMEKIEEAKG